MIDRGAPPQDPAKSARTRAGRLTGGSGQGRVGRLPRPARISHLRSVERVRGLGRQAIRHQQAAFGNFFAGRARYPRYKSRTGRQSAEYTRSGFRFS